MRKLFLLLAIPTLVQADIYPLAPTSEWLILICDPANTSLTEEVYANVCGAELPASSSVEAAIPPLEPGSQTLAPIGVATEDPTVTLELSSSEQWVPRFGSVTVSWTSTGAISCTASGDWTGTLTVHGVVRMDALTEDQAYTLVCENSTKSALAILNVYVRQAILSWEPPVTNTNGSSLTDLEGYRIYWGTSSGSYENTLDVEDPAQTSLTLELSPGTYYFAITAMNSKGLESPFSAEKSKTID